MAITGAVSMGMGSLNFGLFIKPMGDELGIGRAAFGWAQTARMGASSATSPLIGWLIDRYGSRVMLPVAASGYRWRVDRARVCHNVVASGGALRGDGVGWNERSRRVGYDGSGVEVVCEESGKGGGVRGAWNTVRGIDLHSVDAGADQRDRLAERVDRFGDHRYMR